MKAFTIIMKIVTAVAAVVGAVYIAATYGDKIVAWAKKVLASCPCCKEDVADACCGEEECQCGGACTCGEEGCTCEEAAEETVAEEVVVEEAAAEEAPAEDAPVADEADFEG